MFGSKCYILNTKDQLHKFDELFLGYTLNDACYKTYNLETNVVEESTNAVFDEVKSNKESINKWFMV